jgi:hypothetical protein
MSKHPITAITRTVYRVAEARRIRDAYAAAHPELTYKVENCGNGWAAVSVATRGGAFIGWAG